MSPLKVLAEPHVTRKHLNTQTLVTDLLFFSTTNLDELAKLFVYLLILL